MNRYRYLLMVPFLLLLLTGCGNWLDVTPKAQVSMDKMFSTEKGYEDVLIGCYTSMTKSTVYGGDMTFGILDAMAQYYETDAMSHRYYDAAKFDFSGETSKKILSDMWLDSYYSIANCNAILDNLKKADPAIFINGNRPFIEAEAKALRAVLHFNLLRIFAPTWNNGVDKLSIPYADELRPEPFKQLKMRDFMDRVLSDLEDGYKLLKDIDPVFDERFKQPMYHFTQPMDSEFLSARAYRMNYFAIAGMLARVHLFMGDKEKAFKYASEILTDKDRFTFTTESELSSSTIKSRNVNFQNEIIFGLSHPTHYKIFKFDYHNSTASCFLFNPNDVWNYADDFRKLYAIGEDTQKRKFYSLRYEELDGYGGKIALIRMSEIYYIAAEAIYETNPQLACDYFNEFRLNRGIRASVSPSTYEQFMKELTLDARREFLGEGQMFYWYKRLGMNPLKGASEVVVSADKMVLPLPDTEVEFGDYELKK